MLSSPFLSRYGLPLLAVVLVHGLLLALLVRGLPPPSPPPLSLLPVALLGPAPAVPGEAAPAPAEPPAAADPAAALVPDPAPPLPVAPAATSAAVPAPADALPAPGGPLQAPLADAVPAAALDDPRAPPGNGGGTGAAPAAARADVEARLAPGTPEPPYPDDARRFREEGSVTLQLQVRADGRLRDVKVLRSSGFPRLDRAARDAAWRWRVLPAERGGRPVDSLFEKTLHFRLED